MLDVSALKKARGGEGVSHMLTKPDKGVGKH